ncbi:MAG: MinD/ParA family protein [Candidatus Abyssobacteria bacterium SURF_17]|uniref:MinD/ParA family protein n=1 Tax=Candidatus Abyssobacteria bacterium SURF_17 TaxID=2093361 RepID=A0A419EZS0_9BACT|nr:MAG: MinD/ParA family protein [Candidatus Abyssubacteria bacterium SURF_17]
MRKGVPDGLRRIITIAGCKGGVGKSVIACAIAMEVGRSGENVILVDADLGGPNLHTYLGVQSPAYVMSDFLSRRTKRIDEIVVPTEYPGVRFISSAGNVPGQANPKFAQKAKIINSIYSLNADCIILDIGAGSSYDVMDFFSMTDAGILVTTAEPASIINSYGFVKNVLYRRFCLEFRAYPVVMDLLKRGMNPDGDAGISAINEIMGELASLSPQCWLKAKSVLSSFRPNIIVNMTTSESEARLGQKLKTIIGKYLSVDATCLGHVFEDPAVRASAKKLVPFMVAEPDCKAAACVRKIVERLLYPAQDVPESEPLTAEVVQD